MSYEFDVVKSTNNLIQWIRDWFESNGKGCNAVVGTSGGKDSSVVAALCVEALGKDRVIGVLMPDGEQSDIQDAEKLVEHLGIDNYVINIGGVVGNLIENIEYSCDYQGFPKAQNHPWVSEQTRVNLPARIRMATLYAVSQSNNGRVANTCNLSEDWVGYSTRYGDAAGDFSPFAQFTSEEVVLIGDYLGLPFELTHKVPSDGLCGKTDEQNLGFTYAALNQYIRTGVIEDTNIKEKIDTMHQKNLFKLELMPSYQSGLPIVAE